MRAGRRDLAALSVAERLTAAAEDMRRKSTHLETVREVDPAEIEKLRRDFSEAVTLLAKEVMALKAVMAEVRDITEDELRRRA